MMMETTPSLQHAAVTESQTDTGYQSNIMQTTGVHDGQLSTTGVQRQHSAASAELMTCENTVDLHLVSRIGNIAKV